MPLQRLGVQYIVALDVKREIYMRKQLVTCVGQGRASSAHSSETDRALLPPASATVSLYLHKLLLLPVHTPLHRDHINPCILY